MHDRLRFGAVDLGSNSVRCLAVSVSGGVLEYVASGVWISRVTEGIREGEYAVGGKALERTLEAVGKAFQLLERSGVTGGHISFCATESLRSAINSGEVVARMESLTGLTPRVLDPEEEARLGRKGASLGIPGAGWVFDLGGGSLDIGTPHRSFSFPLGAVRMTALFGEEPEAVMEEVRSVIGKSLEGGPGNLVGKRRRKRTRKFQQSATKRGPGSTRAKNSTHTESRESKRKEPQNKGRSTINQTPKS